MSKSSGKPKRKTGHEARPIPKKAAEAAAIIPTPDKPAPFDRLAYQRLYMREYRKRKRAAT